MSMIRSVTLPTQEPVSVAEAQDFLRIPRTQDATIVGSLITTAREACENITGRALAQRKFVMTLDQFPYFFDTVTSQQAYSPNSLAPRYSATTLWNHSQQIKIWYPPTLEIEKVTYIGTDGLPHDLLPGQDFIADYVNEPCRIFPLLGGFWPPALTIPNAVAIYLTAGYDPDPTKTATLDPFAANNLTPPDPPNMITGYDLVTGVPQAARTAILMLVNHLYNNREPVVAGGANEVPDHIQTLLAGITVFDLCPTRG